MMEKDERGTGDPAFECTAITYNARRVDECAKARRREQRRSRKDSARQMESNDRDTRAARRVVGKRLTPWRRPAPPDAAHASYLKELTHPSSQCRPKTTVTSSFLTRCLWNPSSLCSLYPPFFSLLSSAFDFLLYFFFTFFSFYPLAWTFLFFLFSVLFLHPPFCLVSTRCRYFSSTRILDVDIGVIAYFVLDRYSSYKKGTIKKQSDGCHYQTLVLPFCYFRI